MAPVEEQWVLRTLEVALLLRCVGWGIVSKGITAFPLQYNSSLNPVHWTLGFDYPRAEPPISGGFSHGPVERLKLLFELQRMLGRFPTAMLQNDSSRLADKPLAYIIRVE